MKKMTRSWLSSIFVLYGLSLDPTRTQFVVGYVPVGFDLFGRPKSSFPSPAGRPFSKVVTMMLPMRLPQRHQENDTLSQSPKFFWRVSSSSSLSLSSSLRSNDNDNNNNWRMDDVPSSRVVDAIEKNGRNRRVVAADVAAAAGISLSRARRELTALASISRGDIAVNVDGELIYTFPDNLPTVLAQYSLRYKALQIFQKTWPVLFWGIRVSFGIALVASVVAIFSTIFFIQTSSSSNNDDREDNRRNRSNSGMSFGGSWNYWWGPSPFDFFYYRPYGYYGYYGMSVQEQRQRKWPENMGFLESVFSFVFGDGDPNAGLEEKRLALAANLIRQNQGSVTAEQLAPFCQDAPPPHELADKTYVDESFVLPIVTALDGEPRVTEDGDIVYVFPELQKSASLESSTTSFAPSMTRDSWILRRAGLNENASNRDVKRFLEYNGINTRGVLERKDLLQILGQVLPPPSEQEEAQLTQSDPSLLVEREWKFSLASDLNKILAGGLGVVNLGGALYLGNLFSRIVPMYGQLPGWYGMVQAFYPFLLAYAIAYNVIPLARNFWIRQQNVKIQNRNNIRQSWKNALATSLQSSATFRKKLAAAKKMQTRLEQVGYKDIVFDTAQSMEEIQKDKVQRALDDFDSKLWESGGDTNSKTAS